MMVQPLSVDEIMSGAADRASTPHDAIKIARETLEAQGYQIVHVAPGVRLQKVVDVKTASEKANVPR